MKLYLLLLLKDLQNLHSNWIKSTKSKLEVSKYLYGGGLHPFAQDTTPTNAAKK